jgi:selenide,water dikinase
MSVRLTKVAKRAGCAAKHPPGYLFPLLGRLPAVTDPNVLVGSATADDAAIYKLDDERALVLTTDFFTPIVDDPYEFGAIAATNALSDVYAMGGRPLTALNIVGFPDELLDVEVLAEILRGGAEKAKEAGIDIVGGHTIKTDEPIYGLAVTGMVDPRRIASNAGGRPGDVLVLTKPIGLGIITTAAKQDRDSLGAIVEAIRLMSTLNRGAAEAMATVDVHACTDITGFGLLGHLRNIARASACVAHVRLASVPVIEAAWAYVREDIAPGGTHANWRFLNDCVEYEAGIDKPSQLVLCDAQTSGGLLIAVAPRDADKLVAELRARNTPCAALIGGLEEGTAGRLRVSAH